jgi:hypothetical protein
MLSGGLPPLGNCQRNQRSWHSQRSRIHHCGMGYSLLFPRAAPRGRQRHHSARRRLRHATPLEVMTPMVGATMIRARSAADLLISAETLELAVAAPWHDGPPTNAVTYARLEAVEDTPSKLEEDEIPLPNSIGARPSCLSCTLGGACSTPWYPSRSFCAYTSLEQRSP